MAKFWTKNQAIWSNCFYSSCQNWPSWFEVVSEWVFAFPFRTVDWFAKSVCAWVSVFEGRGQCDQMAKLIVQYLASDNRGNLPNSITNLQIGIKSLSNVKWTLTLKLQRLWIWAKVPKFRHIWSHWSWIRPLTHWSWIQPLTQSCGQRIESRLCHKWEIKTE